VLAVINDTGILVVLVAVILLFGASQIPKLARNLGEASKEFRKAHEEATPPATPSPDQVSISRSELEALLSTASQAPRSESTPTPPPPGA
jgi:sec-independent protein translocase protein TatA